MRRAEIWWAELPPPVGPRPVVVLTRGEKGDAALFGTPVPEAPRGSERDDASHHHPGICPTAHSLNRVNRGGSRHPTGFRRGLLEVRP
jgi:hypothetical protein